MFNWWVSPNDDGSGRVEDSGGVSDIPRYVGEVSVHQFAFEWQGGLLHAHGQFWRSRDPFGWSVEQGTFTYCFYSISVLFHCLTI